MLAFLRRCLPFLLLFCTLTLLEVSLTAEYADARSQSGGRSFGSPSSRPAPQQAPSQFNQRQQTPPPPPPPSQKPAPQSGGFGRGFMGGLLGGAVGSMLFGSLFGASGGSGMGILPLLLLAGVGYFLYKRFVNRPQPPSSGTSSSPFDLNRLRESLSGLAGQGTPGEQGGSPVPPVPPAPPTPPLREPGGKEQGLAAIRLTDPGFDEKYFLEVASDVFFKVQAGWMRRDLASYRNLLGTQLASEYEAHFKRMQEQCQINKLESIAIRRLEIVGAGSENGEDYVTVLFTANLLDYIVNDKTGALVSGSMTEPVKFAERWTWARPIRTENWKLEGIEVGEG